MKKTSMVILIAFIAGCATSSSVVKNESSNPIDGSMKNEFVEEIVLKKFEENGEFILCDQPSYSRCFNISKDQCAAEIAPHKIKCMEKAKEKVPNMHEKEDITKFTSYFLVCMAMNQMLLHSDKVGEIGQCLKTAQYDEEIGQKSFLKAQK